MDFKRLFIVIQLIVSSFAYSQSSLAGYKLIGSSTGITQLTEAQVKDYFKGKYTLWKTGKSVKIVLYSSQSQHSVPLAKSIYNTTPQGVKKYWLSLVFQGRANPPTFLESDSAIITYIQDTPGAMGFIQQNTTCPSQLIIQIK
jgi:hypothetical protein